MEPQRKTPPETEAERNFTAAAPDLPPDLPPDSPDLPPDSPDLPLDLQQPDLPSDSQPPDPQGRRPLHNVCTQTIGHRQRRQHFHRPPSALTIKAASLPDHHEPKSQDQIPSSVSYRYQIPEEGKHTSIKQHHSGGQEDHKRDQHYHVLWLTRPLAVHSQQDPALLPLLREPGLRRLQARARTLPNPTRWPLSHKGQRADTHPHLPQTPNAPSSWHLFLLIFDSGVHLAIMTKGGTSPISAASITGLNRSQPPQSNRRCCLEHGLSGNIDARQVVRR